MPRILLIAEFDRFGGTRTYFETLIRYYAELGYEVTVGLSEAQLDDEVMALLRQCKAGWVKVLNRSRHFRNIWWRLPYSILFDFIAMAGIFRKGKYDLLVASVGSPWIYWGIAFFPYKLIYVLHTCPTIGRRGWREVVRQWIVGRRLGPKRRIVTVSNFAKRQILEGWVGKDGELWVHAIYNTAGFIQSLLSTALKKKEKVRILTLGHVTSYKNPIGWIDIAEFVINRCRDCDVEFIWGGDGDLIESCRSEVRTRGLELQVRFVGVVRDVDGLYQTSDIYLQPSLLESQGLAVLDAMRHGLPCVTSTAGGLPESVVDNATGFLVDVDDIASVSEKVLVLVLDRVKRETLGHEGRNRYNEVFSPHIWQTRMNALHTELLA